VAFRKEDLDAAFEKARRLIDAYRTRYPEPLSLAEKIAAAKQVDPIASMYRDLKAAAEAGHPNARISKRSGEPVFMCRFPLFRNGGSFWSHESAQLAYLDPDLAREQMAFAGIDW
jgi:hypothetical protein